MKTGPRSPLAGFLVSIPVALAVWVVTLCAYVLVTEGPVRAGGITIYAVMGGVLFGIPLLAALILLVAVPLNIVLRGTIGVTLPVAVVVAAACGVLVRILVEQLWGEPEVGFVPWPVVLITGAVTGWIWWRAAHTDVASSRSI